MVTKVGMVNGAKSALLHYPPPRRETYENILTAVGMMKTWLVTNVPQNSQLTL